jgi:hypothetical protein
MSGKQTSNDIVSQRTIELHQEWQQPRSATQEDEQSEDEHSDVLYQLPTKHSLYSSSNNKNLGIEEST